MSTPASTTRWRCSTPARTKRPQILGVSTVVGNVPPRRRDAQHPGGSQACRARRHPRLAGRADRAVDLGQGRERDPRQDRPRPCGPARARGASPSAPRSRRHHRLRARTRGASHPVRHRAIDQYRARADARARAAAPRQAVRHHGRRLCRARQCHAGGRIQHLARSRGGADRLSLVRRRGRGAGDRDRPRRHPQDDHRRKRSRRDRVAHRGQAAWVRADPLPRRRLALLFRPDGKDLREAHLHHARPAGGRGRRSIRPWSRRAKPPSTSRPPGRLTTGATIADWRGQWGRLANAEVAVAVDAERFRRLFFAAMDRLADGAGARCPIIERAPNAPVRQPPEFKPGGRSRISRLSPRLYCLQD